MDFNGKNIVLAVDDSLMVCKQIQTALKDEPVFLCEAHNGQEAVDMAMQYQPDLILLDVVLPDIEGYELIGKLKEVGQEEAAVLFLTSKDKDEDVVKGFSMGACDYIKKPFATAELRSRVHAHLEMKKQKDMLNRQNKELLTNMEKLNFMAFRDGLTGLYNRRYVVGNLMEDMKDHNAEKATEVLIMADIDDFKRINDTYGHDAGDAALVCIANILEEQCREHRVIRWGGEEFLIVLFAVTEEEAFEISERIRKEVEAFRIYHPDGEFSCTLTLGLHTYQEPDRIEDSVNCAYKALYYGKRNGKNRSVWYKDIR